METWKPAMGYEGIYEVSDHGNIRRVAYFDAMSQGHHELYRAMKQNRSKIGYLRIKLMKNGRPRMELVHRLVAEAFIDNPDRLPCVNHIDADKDNNHVSNLQWCTHKENNEHAVRHGLRNMKNKKGSVPVGMYDAQTGELVATYPSMREAQRQTGFPFANIQRCCDGKLKTSHGHIWRRLPPDETGEQNPSDNFPAQRPSNEDRFWSKVQKSDDPNGCWNWIAYKAKNGRGSLRWHGKTQLAYRVAYELTYGPIPHGLHVLHSCDNPSCVNPSHLSLGTNQENVRDMVKKGRNRNAKGMSLHRLTKTQVQEIRERYQAGGVTQRELSQEFGVGHKEISRIVRRKRWA